MPVSVCSYKALTILYWASQTPHPLWGPYGIHIDDTVIMCNGKTVYVLWNTPRASAGEEGIMESPKVKKGN